MKNIIIKQATKDDVTAIAKVHFNSFNDTYQNIIPQEYIKTLRSYAQRVTLWSQLLQKQEDKWLCLVACDALSQQIIGFISAGPIREPFENYTGEIEALYLIRKYRGQGIGGELFKACIKEMKLLGYKKIIAWALSDNEYRKFYVKMGSTIVAHRTIVLGKALEEVAYGFDLSATN